MKDKIELPPLPAADPHFNKNSGFACSLHTNYTLIAYARLAVKQERERVAARQGQEP